MSESAPWVEVRSVAALHDWLAAHHYTAGSAWVVTFKKGQDGYLPFPEVVEELLCWGWVDSAVRAVDAARMRHLMSPRSPKSAWSAVNKDIVARMRAAGRMQPGGESAIAAAMANGMWNFLDDVEALVVPDDLAKALGDGRSVWNDYPRSVKRGTLEWLKMAKTDATRARRVASIADAAAMGQRPPLFQR